MGRWGRVGGSCLWRSWGGTDARRAQRPAALHPLCPSLLSVQRPRGETRGCMPSLPASTCAHSEFQVPNPCAFTSLGSPAALKVVTFGSKGPSQPCSESLEGWGREEGGHQHRWCLCGPPCLAVHWGTGAVPTPVTHCAQLLSSRPSLCRAGLDLISVPGLVQKVQFIQGIFGEASAPSY